MLSYAMEVFKYHANMHLLLALVFFRIIHIAYVLHFLDKQKEMNEL